MPIKGTTTKQEKWAHAYVKLGDATAAAIEAGYSPNRANQIGWLNRNNPKVMAIVDELLKKTRSKAVADAQEVLEFLTAVMRNEVTEDTVVTEGKGLGFSESRLLSKGATVDARVKAAKALAKRYGLDTSAQNDGALERLDAILNKIDDNMNNG